jgi:hypothetical protein
VDGRGLSRCAGEHRLVRRGQEEVIVDVLKSDDVSSIFRGELQPDRELA